MTSPPAVEPVKLLAEHAVVDKRQVDTGVVRVATHGVQTEQPVQVPLQSESVEIERVPIDRVVEQREAPRIEGDTTVWPIYEERAVVSRQLVLKEEVRISRRTHSRLSAVETVVLRHDVLTVTREGPSHHRDAPAQPSTMKEP